MKITVTLRFWGAKRDQPLTVTLRALPEEVVDHAAGVWLRGDVVDGDDTFGPGRVDLFVPYRQLLWIVEREDSST